MNLIDQILIDEEGDITLPSINGVTSVTLTAEEAILLINEGIRLPSGVEAFTVQGQLVKALLSDLPPNEDGWVR